MEDEDGDFMVPGSSRSRLSSLFHSENSSGDINQALTFTAPKQPKKSDNTQGASGALKLLHAAAVHAYKLKDGNYSNQGKLGCAILGHHETFSYKLLLYKGKQIQVTVATITPNFIFHVQPNNYANFYDEKKENWSINFDSEAALLEFTKQLALAKANAQGKSPSTLVIQDIINGESSPLETGDAAELKYTGWLLSNFTFGQVFDSNMNTDSLYRVRLGKSKVIKGWNEGLLGMQKGGKRLLIIPSDLAYGSEGMGNIIPPNSVLIFEIHVVKIKTVRESSHSPSPVKVSDSAPDKKPDVPPRQSFSQEDNIKSRGASISEQLSQSPKKDKAQLISRMAKMGTATLPFQGAIPAQVSSDSESEGEVPPPSSPAPSNISRTSSPKSLTKARSRTNSGQILANQSIQPQPTAAAMPFHVNQPSSQVTLYEQSIVSSQPPLVCAATPFPSYSPQLPGQYSLPQSPFSVQNVPGLVPSIATSVVDSHLPLLITETRNQNTEVRISLSKISDKVDSVLHKVDDLRLHGRAPSANMPYMESTILLQNIERIVQENIHLKEDVEIKNSKIQSLNEKICDLFQRNQGFFEESNSMLEQKSDSLQAASAQSQEKILTLEQEKAKLQLELSTSTIKLNSLETDLLKYQKLENELQQKLLEAERETRKHENLIKNAEEHVKDDQSLLNSLQEKVKSLEQEKSILTTKVQNLEQEHSKFQESSDSVEVFKKEIQQYKEKMEQMSSAISVTSASSKLQDEVEKLKLELDENIKLKDEMEVKVSGMQKKLDSNEELKAFYEEKLKKLAAEVENSQVVRKKYEVFQEKTRAMKERYDSQIVELMNEIRHLQNVRSVGTSPEFSAEIKKVMNMLYKLLQGRFDANASYSGSKVLETVLQTIMGLTLQILEKKKQSLSEPTSSDEASKKENAPEQEPSSVEGVSQSEFSQQNGINELQVNEAAPTEEHFCDSGSSDIDQTQQSETQSGDSVITKEDTSKDTHESAVSSTQGDVMKSEEKLSVQVPEANNRESPETNLQPPPTNLFSELLTGTDGSKV